MAGLEADDEEWVCDEAEKLGVTNLKLNVQGNTGYPDRIFWIPGGSPLLIEFKQKGEKPEPRQNLIHAQLLFKGYDVQTHDDKIQALAAIRAALGAAPVPDKGRQLLARSLFSSLVSGSRTGQDKQRVRRRKGSAT